MKAFELTLLGTSSSQPAFGRFPSSQLLQYDNHYFMIDCGEGIQIQLSRYKIKRNRINTIFISHLHGDHIYGLPGVVTSFLHHQRSEPLRIIGPIGIKAYLETCLGLSEVHLAFRLEIEEKDATRGGIIYENERIMVSAIPLKHRIPTMGFLFTEKEVFYRLIPEKIIAFDLSHEEMHMLKSGKTVFRSEGEPGITPSDVCHPLAKLRSYAYISDTIYDQSVVPIIQGVDVLYHETTYLKDMEKEAIDRMHATSEQAANIASLAGAGRLITGHYSSRYRSIQEFETECREIFTATFLGMEGMVIKI
ncbi:MAG: ribonuclease Z [Saprospiraceae bacterium]|nr:ribonuclease Z [Saprospiraceae bacterium]